jgi:hypothetical protein
MSTEENKANWRAKSAKWRKANPEKVKERKAKWFKDHQQELQAKSAKWRKANPEKCKGYYTKWILKNREWFNSIKQTLLCKKCGENRWYCLEFHHRDPKEKEAQISYIIDRWSQKRILAEMAKCDILCANCHKAFHWEEKNKE